MQTIALAEAADLVRWAPAWDRRARELGALVFQSTAWLGAWWSQLEPDARPMLMVEGDPDEVHYGIALSWMRRRVQRRVPVGFTYLGIAGSGRGAADHLGPLTASTHQARRLFDEARLVAGDRPLLLANLAPCWHQVFDEIEGTESLATIPCPYLDLREDPHPERRWSSSRATDVRRCRRRLAEAGYEVVWDRLDSSNLGLLDELQGLHQKLWTARGKTGLLPDDRKRFLADLAVRLDAPDGAYLQRIVGPGGTIAALLALRFGSSLCSYTTGWDPGYRKLGLGVLLEVGGIERAQADGLGRYDFLRGAERHKLALGASVETDRTACVPGGLFGQAFVGRERLAEQRTVDWNRALPSVGAAALFAEVMNRGDLAAGLVSQVG